MTEPNSAFEGLVRDFKAAALNAGARDMEATVNPAYDSANVQLHYDLMNAAEKALLDAYAKVEARASALEDDSKECGEKHCWGCGNPEISGDPERHVHEPKGGHWHHYIEGGPGECKNSDMLERVFQQLQSDLAGGTPENCIWLQVQKPEEERT